VTARSRALSFCAKCQRSKFEIGTAIRESHDLGPGDLASFSAIQVDFPVLRETLDRVDESELRSQQFRCRSRQVIG
jgi:hypothetical protein